VTLDHEHVRAALPRYEVGEELGRGGWGIVLGGRHRALDREVAIKELPRAFGADPAVRARFAAEARVLASLEHPHIVPIYDYVEREGLCLLVMEKLPGGSVWSRFTSSGVAMEEACAITLATCAALECAHAHGVLHRDIKPENLLFSHAGVLKTTDFGIAKVLSGSETLATQAGEVLGTPAYMAPEQAQGAELSPATDVYATGTMLYELLSGQLPFSDEGSPLAVVYRHVYEEPLPLADVAPGIPATIASVIMRAIQSTPADRYPSADALGVALAEAATGCWGPGWLTRSGFPLLGAAEMVAVTEGSSLRGSANGSPSTAPGKLPRVGPAGVTLRRSRDGAAPPTVAKSSPDRPAPATEPALLGTSCLLSTRRCQ
jgi:serine/threonine-protein kinase